ncbi:unnamed protein product [Clonostachys chloroleuca]|uniref:Secreted protein n=1 Tax=Clonostachys chloroleuca TaxID=1926264 RepID=A0AA35PSL1_9HYPO|nr:unnamed protein product [Clonostachys chloroleuca]
MKGSIWVGIAILLCCGDVFSQYKEEADTSGATEREPTVTDYGLFVLVEWERRCQSYAAEKARSKNKESKKAKEESICGGKEISSGCEEAGRIAEDSGQATEEGQVS